MLTVKQQKNRDFWKKHFLRPVSCRNKIVFLFLISLLQACSFSTKQAISTRHDALPPIKAIQVDLDYVYDTDPLQQQRNIDLLKERVKELGINTVFLQAFADPDGNGVAESLYFPSRFLPLRENLFSPTAKALRKEGVAVFGWLPLLAFKLPEKNIELYVHRTNDYYKVIQSPSEHLRLSPFNPISRKIIEGIYRDFAHKTTVDGILFHDDGVLADFEDSSEAALQEYKRAGFPSDIKTIHNNLEILRKWSHYKTRYLTDFSLILLDIIRQEQPGIFSVRNIFASPVLHPESEMWFAQSLPVFLQAYDYTALMAMPFMEKSNDTQGWLKQLSWAALAHEKNNNRIIFELQTKNWETRKPVPSDVLRQQIILLFQMGGTSFAYYPDDFYKNLPPAEMINSCFSNLEACNQQ